MEQVVTSVEHYQNEAFHQSAEVPALAFPLLHHDSTLFFQSLGGNAFFRQYKEALSFQQTRDEVN